MIKTTETLRQEVETLLNSKPLSENEIARTLKRSGPERVLKALTDMVSEGLLIQTRKDPASPTYYQLANVS